MPGRPDSPCARAEFYLCHLPESVSGRVPVGIPLCEQGAAGRGPCGGLAPLPRVSCWPGSCRPCQRSSRGSRGRGCVSGPRLHRGRADQRRRSHRALFCTGGAAGAVGAGPSAVHTGGWPRLEGCGARLLPCAGPRAWLGEPGLDAARARASLGVWGGFASGAVFRWLSEMERWLHPCCNLLSRRCIFLSFGFCKPVRDQLELFTDQVLLLT